MNNKSIYVYPCGTNVTTKIGGIQGMITCASVRFETVSYEITYLIDDKFETVWMREGEFITEGKKVALGYKP